MELVRKNKEFIIVLFLLILATFLRLYRIDGYMTFLGDEGRDALVVRDILQGRFTLLGPTSSVGGFFLGPIYYYFMAPFLWLFNFDPVGPAIMVGLFGVATVFLIYKVGSEFFDKKAGYIAALIYAISPLVIAYSRSSWNPNVMPFFSLLMLYTLYKAVHKNSNLLFVICGLLFGVLMQLHYVATFLIPVILLYIFFVQFYPFFKKKSLKKVVYVIKSYLWIFIGFIIGWSPFLTFEVRHGFPNTQSIIRFIFHSGDTGTTTQFMPIVGNVLFRLYGRLITTYPPPEQVSIKAHGDIALWYYFTLFLSVTSIAIFLYQYKRLFPYSDIKFQQYTLLLFWLTIGILLFGFYKKPIYDYYFQFMFPIPFLMVGKTFSFLFQQKTSYKMIVCCFLVIILWLNLSGIPFRFSPNKQKDQVKEIAEFVLSKTDNKPFNFALITLGNSDHGYRYFFELKNRKPITILNPQVDPKRRSVTDQLVVICEDLDCKPLGHSLWEVAGFGRAEIAQEWNISVVKVYKLVHYQGKE